MYQMKEKSLVTNEKKTASLQLASELNGGHFRDGHSGFIKFLTIENRNLKNRILHKSSDCKTLVDVSDLKIALKKL